MLITEKPVGPTSPPRPYSITDLPPLIVGGATFNYQYTDNPEAAPIYEILDTAFNSGLIAVDTSPYYGPSEILVGKALTELSTKWPRETYFICTKAGRIALNEFDYSASAIRKSVKRSLERLNTEYLDLVYLHDIEFGEIDDIMDGLKELKRLKAEGIVKNIGITGYPVDFLYRVALAAHNNEEIGSLDAILSYCHGCIQNTTLFEYYSKFFDECHVKKIMNGSILSMSLLRSGKTHTFHPGSTELKEAVAAVAKDLSEQGVELAELSTRFALKSWLFDTSKATQSDKTNLSWNKKTSVVLGLGNVDELMSAITNFWKVKLNVSNSSEDDAKYVAQVQQQLGSHFNESWESGIEHDI
ncbi:D-arabinose 1-dehydrogenase [Yamadazyma tenuis]|uniref:D-threo-aldose 1-dehydrogenase n=1 Tax=Candida tenuis (strain ATCC 10573 / BCRC 21748 / CBS 615 / JCM 9827 / NBRC 10315 / NRRL Y-1498 / VKM Y-70) TaxID=590646 RepID=G3B3D5_CANTC|nr:D-threo-aldose 1-dehydrogenase [Yamadazyma tenuis ATCC 10573]EGV64142.1 D-threo-aldose 1-dehydrogenase [Yamadazyma tenuis ATCC 10573]WEJ96219.1 D-arabinose 1-dehydrogenase [Yamadazyma tenuis]